MEQLDRLEQWIAKEFGSKAAESLLAEPLATLKQLRQQDLEPDPPDNKPRIRKGTAVDRRVSVEGKDMRHGRNGRATTVILTYGCVREPNACAGPLRCGGMKNCCAPTDARGVRDGFMDCQF